MSTTTMVCGECGVEFAMPGVLYNARLNDGEIFYCPNGHPRCFRPTKAEKRIAELERQLVTTENTRCRMRDQADELLAQREDFILALKECPGRCGWRSRRQVPRDPMNMGRGIERVRVDVALHLMEAHGARACQPLELGAGS